MNFVGMHLVCYVRLKGIIYYTSVGDGGLRISIALSPLST